MRIACLRRVCAAPPAAVVMDVCSLVVLMAQQGEMLTAGLRPVYAALAAVVEGVARWVPVLLAFSTRVLSATVVGDLV